MPRRWDEFSAGVTGVAPMLPGVAPFGVIAGLTAISTGLEPVQALAMSVAIFAGASQLASLQLIGDGAMPAIVLLTVATINLRFAMYSASLAPYFQHLGRRWRWPLAYFLVDQNYALSINRYRAAGEVTIPQGHWFYLGAGVTMWLTWQVATAVGVFMGGSVPASWSLDFAIPLVFMVLLVPTLQDWPHVTAAVVGGTVATLAADVPLHLGIVLGATSGIVAGTWLEYRAASRTGHGSAGQAAEDSRRE